MNTISNKMVCVSQAMAAKAKCELAGEIAKLEALGAANLLALALVQALGDAQNCKTLRELREQVRERMLGVVQAPDTAWVLNTLRDCGIDSVADGLNGMLTSIACIMNCKRNVEMREHFQYFDRVKEGMFPVIHRRMELATTKAQMAQVTAQRWRKRVGEYARNRLPAVAVSKKDRKHAIAQHYAAWTDISTGEYVYWQPLQTSKYPFQMWVLAMKLNYQVWNVSHSKW